MAFCGSVALFIGYSAGLRFRVACLLLLELAAVPVVVGSAMLGRLSAFEAAEGFLLFSVALQAGYGLALVRPIPLRLAGQRRSVKA